MLQYHQQLWDYTCQIYENKTVQLPCLQLQDEFNCNINVILYSCWHGAQHWQPLQPEHFEVIGQSLNHWHVAVTKPLRSSRRWLRLHPKESIRTEDFYNTLLKVELDAEKLEQQLILDGIEPNWLITNSKLSAESIAAQNLLHYLQCICQKNSSTIALINQISTQAFNENNS